MSSDPKGTLLAMPGVSRPDAPLASQPVPEVVQALEDLLAKAKTGYIRAIGFSYVRSSERISYGFFGVKKNLVTMHLLHSGLHVAATDMGQGIADTSIDVDPSDTEAD